MMPPRSRRIIVALDTQDFKECRKWVRDLRGLVGCFKIGSELFTSVGADAVRYVHDQGAEVFLDLKFHDIPNTVYRAAEAAGRLGVKMFNVHCSGGLAMMRAAREALSSGPRRPWVLGVTVLTSLGEKELSRELGVKTPLRNQVLHLAKLGEAAGLDGVVASAEEVALIKKKIGIHFKVVTPGIRPLWSVKGDQARVVPPREAFKRGADFIVVGRPITGAKDRKGAARRVAEELAL
jgi:orotidine-5'-phosphate decarboxylase